MNRARGEASYCAGTTLYGTTYTGGLVDPQRGALYKLSTNGTGYVVLGYFNGDSFGANPCGNLVLANGAVYGTTQFGGRYESGVLFVLSLTPPAVLPESQTAETGSAARFAVDAPHFWSAQYQWFRNGSNALSSLMTNSWLRLTNIQSSQGGLYTAVITQAGGALTSSPALLSVIQQVERRQTPGVKVTGEPGAG